MNMRVGNRYEYDPIQDLLDKKGFGTVYRAVDTLENKVVALKCIPPDLLPTHYSLSDEILRVKYHSHEHLIKYYDVLEEELPVEITALPEGEVPETPDLTSSLVKTEEKMTFQVVVMEYVEGQTLDKYPIYNLTEETLQFLLRDILEGLHYLHDHRIIHRDFRQTKIIIQEKAGQLIPKILYFGLSNQLNLYMSNYGYLPPERLGKYDEMITEMSDIWMFGVLVYELLTNQLPFGSIKDGLANDTIMVNVLGGQMTGDTSYLIPPYKTIVEKCLENDPSQRFQEVSEILTYFPAQAQPLSTEEDNPTESTSEIAEKTVNEDTSKYSNFETTGGFGDTLDDNVDEIAEKTANEDTSKYSSFETTRGFGDTLDDRIVADNNTPTSQEEEDYIYGTEDYEPVVIGEPQYVPSEAETTQEPATKIKDKSLLDTLDETTSFDEQKEKRVNRLLWIVLILSTTLALFAIFFLIQYDSKKTQLDDAHYQTKTLVSINSVSFLT
ncbi:MAG TPA: hypothetical protein DCS93_16545 [Microscillaceae bacterium]|nr:hypothetical protein [Microscillaceae bacterium]